MAYYTRLVDAELTAWKVKTRRKPLLMRGARQVGKSWAVRHLGESFKYYIEVNFEKRPEIKQVFEEIADVYTIAERLSAIYTTPVVPGETLLFLDEIQSCPEAINSLWAFKEDYPELHVVGAGSLLEFTLKEMPSFGVGRISSLFVYPMSFDEFLMADGKDMWIDAKRKADSLYPLLEVLHKELVQAFRTFLLVGGMPASVATWVETHDYMQCADELDDIRQSYYDDFAKYAKKVDSQLLRSTLHSIIVQVGSKFVYSHVDGGYKAEDVKKALGLLVDAGLAKRVNHTAANGLPLGAEMNNKFKKYIYLDSGLLLRIMDMELGGADILRMQILADVASELVNKGGLTEMVAGWELIKYAPSKSRHDLYYWENLKNGTTSEVDYILSRNMTVLPLEVKSGTSGKMKSLRLFMKSKNISYAIRTSLENYAQLVFTEEGDEGEERKIDVIPLYALSKLW